MSRHVTIFPCRMQDSLSWSETFRLPKIKKRYVQRVREWKTLSPLTSPLHLRWAQLGWVDHKVFDWCGEKNDKDLETTLNFWFCSYEMRDQLQKSSTGYWDMYMCFLHNNISFVSWNSQEKALLLFWRIGKEGIHRPSCSQLQNV